MNRIRELRSNLGLTQKNIAEKLGCNQTAVGKYEREELEPNLEVLSKLADIFNCSIDYIVCREDDFGIITSKPGAVTFTREQSELLAVFDLLPVEQQREVIGFAKALAY